MARFRRMGASSNLALPRYGPYGVRTSFKPVPYNRKRKFQPAAPRMGRRVRPRLSRSFTKTRTKQQRRKGRIVTHGDNQSASYTSIGKKWLSRFEKLLYKKIVSPQAWFQNSTGAVSSTQGKQAGYVMLSTLTKADLDTMKLAANGGVSTSAPVRLFVKACKTTLRLRNQSNTNCKLQVYDIVTKFAPPGTTLDDPQECWAKGLTDYGSATGYQTVGQVPTKSPEFNAYFKINKLTTVYLEPGQQHDHTVFNQFNRIVDSTRFDNSSAQTISGLTRFTMIVFHGTLGHESASAGTVTYTPITLDYAKSYEFTYGWLEVTKKTYAITDANPTTVVDFDFMGETGDADANYAAA